MPLETIIYGRVCMCFQPVIYTRGTKWVTACKYVFHVGNSRVGICRVGIPRISRSQPSMDVGIFHVGIFHVGISLVGIVHT
jgi:3-deoxy-D-arabino-heptulosonate 7-phosphate (DAHP) synthase